MMASTAVSLKALMTSWLIQPLDSSLINAVTGKRVMKAVKRQEGGFLPLTASPLMMKVLGKRVTGRGKEYNNMDYYQ